MWTIFGRWFNKYYAKRLKKHQGWKSPPWADRKNRDIVRSIAHPQFSRDLGILLLCRPESVMATRHALIEYFIRTYGISADTSESWALYMVTRDINAILPTTQIDGVRFFHDDLKIAGPAKNEHAAYENLQSDVKRKDPHINIRIGRSATKEDVKWLLDRYWDDLVAPKIRSGYSKPEDQRRKRQLLRDSAIYSMHTEGKKVKDITEYVNTSLMEEVDDVIDEPLVRKIISEFKPPRDWFAQAVEVLHSLPDEQKEDPLFDIKFIAKPEPHFEIKKYED